MDKRLIFKRISTVFTIFFYLVVAILIFFVISSKAAGGEPALFGYQLKTVLSGSMEPGIQTGSIIAIKTGGDMNRFHENDVITFKKNSNTQVTHRVVEVIEKDGKTMYRTMGDNNDAKDRDPVVTQNVIGEYTGFNVPYAGYLIEFLKSKAGILLLFVLPGIALIGYSLLNVRRIIAQYEKEQKDTNLTPE